MKRVWWTVGMAIVGSCFGWLLKGSGAFVGAVYHVYQLRQDFGCSVTVSATLTRL